MTRFLLCYLGRKILFFDCSVHTNVTHVHQLLFKKSYLIMCSVLCGSSYRVAIYEGITSVEFSGQANGNSFWNFVGHIVGQWLPPSPRPCRMQHLQYQRYFAKTSKKHKFKHFSVSPTLLLFCNTTHLEVGVSQSILSWFHVQSIKSDGEHNSLSIIVPPHVVFAY